MYTHTWVACRLLVYTLYSPQNPSTTLYEGKAARELCIQAACTERQREREIQALHDRSCWTGNEICVYCMHAGAHCSHLFAWEHAAYTSTQHRPTRIQTYTPGLGEERKENLCPSRTLRTFRAPLQSAFREPIEAVLSNWHVDTQPRAPPYPSLALLCSRCCM